MARHTLHRFGVSSAEILAVLQCVSVLGIHSCALGVPILVDELAARETQASSAKR